MNIKKENGSMVIFVLVGLLFMTAFLIITYAGLANKAKSSVEQYNIIKDIYSWSDDYLEDAHYKSIAIEFDKEGVLYITKGETETLEATLINEYDQNVNWEIKDETIAEIEEIDGNTVTIEGLKAGETTITAEYERKIAKLKIKVMIDPTYFTYTTDENKIATITGLSQKGEQEIENEVKKLTIPDIVIDGGEEYIVTKIGNNAFKNCTNFDLNGLPDGLERIGSYAFQNCTNLTLTELPSGITNIETGAFRGCTNIELTELPERITRITSQSFMNCTKLALESLPNGVTYIEDNAFEKCTNLALTELPEGITGLANYAFFRCDNLAITSLPSRLTNIGRQAFYGCTSLTSITMNNLVNNIGLKAFGECSNLITINYTGTETEWNAITKGDSAIPNSTTIVYNYTVPVP